jgi:hypothetical protein
LLLKLFSQILFDVDGGSGRKGPKTSHRISPTHAPAPRSKQGGDSAGLTALLSSISKDFALPR